MSKSKSKQEEALQILDDLDSFTPIPGGEGLQSTSQPTAEGEAEVLAFLDEITQKSSEPTRPTSIDRPVSRSSTPVGSIRKGTAKERVRLGGGPVSSPSKAPVADSKPNTPEPTPTSTKDGTSNYGGGWGWGSVWNTASAALQQAKSAVDEQVKQLPTNEQAMKWRDGMLEIAKSAQIEKLGQDFRRVGMSTLNELLNVVAPPIAEHEIIQVWLSHDMKGYDGIESLVYRALARIMEQVEGGDLIVNKGEESRPKDSSSDGRDLNAVESLLVASRLAQANLDELIKKREATKSEKKPSMASDVTTYSYVYLRIQAFFSEQSFQSSDTVPALLSPSTSEQPSETMVHRHLQFVLYLSDPSHNLFHTTITQAMPAKWLDLWDQYDWVEDLVAEALRVAVEVIGQEYIVSRMGWGGTAGSGGKQKLPSGGEAEATEEFSEKKEEDS